MKKTILTILMSLITSSFMLSQNIIDKKYYKSKYGGSPVDEKNAKVFEITILEPDSSYRYEMRSIKNNKLLSFRCYKNDIPVGKWIYPNGEEIDFDFELKYVDFEYKNVIHYDLNTKTTLTKVNGNFEPPIFPFDDNNFPYFVAKRLRYPEQASENGIQGRVFSQFIIDETGKITQLSIYKGVDADLDKEAARVISQSPDWHPAKLDGKPIKVCIIMPLGFALQ